MRDKRYTVSMDMVRMTMIVIVMLFAMMWGKVPVHAAIATGTSGTCSWVIDDNGVLTIRPTDGMEGTLASYTDGNGPWYSYRSQIKKVVVEPEVNTDTGCYRLFYCLTNCTEMDLANLDTTNATNMQDMFYNCKALTSLDVSGFDTSNVTNMSYMFQSCTALTSLDVSGFDTSNVTTMLQMFQSCSGLTSLDISGFDTSNVTTMYNMFYNCSKLTSLDVSGFDTSKVTNMSGMFSNCKALTSLNLSEFDTSNVTTMYQMFYHCKALTSLDLSGLDTSNVTDMSNMFDGCSALTNLDLSDLDTSNVKDMNCMFYQCSRLTNLNISNLDTSNVTNMNYMFSKCSGLTSLDVSGFDTSNVTSMASMFQSCNGLTSLDVAGFNTSNVTYMDSMFEQCEKLTSLDLSGFDTSNVTNMYKMFYNCSKLTSLDVSGFDTSKVTNMSGMFNSCSALTSLDLSGFDTAKVTNLNYMFNNCIALTSLDVSGFDTSNATTMGAMFSGCSKLASTNLGGDFAFDGKGGISNQALLPTPPSATTTGKWIKFDDQDGNNPLTPAQLRDTYDGDTMSGIWVWQPLADKAIIQFDADTGFTTQPDLVISAVDQMVTMPDSSTTQHPNQTYQLLSWDKDETASFNPGTDYTYTDIEPALGKFVVLKAKWGVPPLNDPEGEYDVYLHGNESINIHDIPAGTAYQVWEETPDGWVLVQQSNSSGSIEPIQAQEASFENNYQPGVATVQFAGTKTLDGKAADANAYQFSLYEGNTLIETVSNITGGFIQFSPIEYEDSDVGTHTYKIKEVDPQDNTIDYDTHTETITVEVADDGEGNLSAVATYDADGIKFANKSRPGVLKLTKTAEGLTEENKDATFTFKITLTNPNGQPISDDETIYWYYEDDDRITRAGRYAKYSVSKVWNNFTDWAGGLLSGEKQESSKEADTEAISIVVE